MFHYIVYKITNLVNGKIYIGSHKTKDINDSYMGSGTRLYHAKLKYGLENFRKEILFVFDNPGEMYAKEAELVNERFLTESATYNLKRGGQGGFDFINEKGLNNTADQYKKASAARVAKLANDPLFRESFSIKQQAAILKQYSLGERTSPFLDSDRQAEMHLRANSADARKKRIKTFAEINHQNGETNSQFGTMWITDKANNRKIKKTDPIPDGWVKGRINGR